MSRVKTVESLVRELKTAFRADQFPHHVHYIRFPHYRSLVPNARLDLGFPVTALIGPNGSGKTSVLQALYGITSSTSVGRFWFATSVDPIDETGNRPAIIYAYKYDGSLREVLKTRIRKTQRGQDDPDYWEPSRPLEKYDMLKPPDGQERTPVVNRPCIYLNFRYYQSAFDRVYYRDLPPSGKLRDYLRATSRHVRSILDQPRIFSRRNAPQNETPIAVQPRVLHDAAEILGKDYSSATLLRHRIFGREWGDTVVFESNSGKYSNAYAGSGEMAVLHLVSSLHEAKDHTLILLDEPEISLHPNAQTKIIKFLLQKALEKKLQVVFSTHAPGMVAGLPPEGIGVFLVDGARYSIATGVHHTTAFNVIGAPVDRPKLIVEDALAKRLVEKAMEEGHTKIQHAFSVEHQPGGAQDIFKRSVVYAEDPQRYALLLDSDQKPGEGDTFTRAGATIKELSQVIKALTKVELDFPVDGSSQTARGNETQRLSAMRNYLEFYRNRVRFLPGVPDDLILELIDSVTAFELDSEARQTISKLPAKKRIAAIAKYTGLMIASVHDILVCHWAKTKPTSFNQLCEILYELCNASGN